MAPRRRRKNRVPRRRFGGAFKRTRRRSPARSGIFKVPKNKQLREQRQSLIDWVASLKKRPCADCLQSFPTVCMDFDHLPGRGKSFTISQFVREHGHLDNARALLEVEIQKCSVVCSNCHRIRTHRRGKLNGFYRKQS
jgi:hypothetical protein